MTCHGALMPTQPWTLCPDCSVTMRPDTFEFHKLEQCAKWKAQAQAPTGTLIPYAQYAEMVHGAPDRVVIVPRPATLRRPRRSHPSKR